MNMLLKRKIKQKLFIFFFYCLNFCTLIVYKITKIRANILCIMSIEKRTQIVYNDINKTNQMEVIKAKMKQLEEIINDLYQNNGRKIHQMCNKRLLKFGGLTQKDYDDFYSAANEACTLAMGTYEESKGSFEGYLCRTIQFTMIDEIQKRNCYKRRAERLCISLDMPVREDERCTLGDLLIDSFDMEQAVFGEEIEENPKIERYLNRLSKCQIGRAHV